jgi:predicted ATPase
VHNFRCLENFELKLGDASSSLLLGKNGSGKSTILDVLSIFQAIGRGRSRVGNLVGLSDLNARTKSTPVRLEIEVLIDKELHSYSLALELPAGFRELRVLDEELRIDSKTIFTRKNASVKRLPKENADPEPLFMLDWHLVALPIFQDTTVKKSIERIRNWMASILLLQPITQNIKEIAEIADPLALEKDTSSFTSWLLELLDLYPASYEPIIKHVQTEIPDLSFFRFEKTGKDSRSMVIGFRKDSEELELPFSALSDGEKCFFICATVLAANKNAGPILAFWDEPDNHLSIHEIEQFIAAIKRNFYQNRGQFVATSHNQQTILCFSDDNTWILGRRSHLEPTQIRSLSELSPIRSEKGSYRPNLIERLIQGDISPWG